MCVPAYMKAHVLRSGSLAVTGVAFSGKLKALASTGRGVVRLCLLTDPGTSIHPLQLSGPWIWLAQTRGVPKVTRGPRPEQRARWIPAPPACPSPLTMGRDARGQPEHETAPARGATAHLQGPSRCRRRPAAIPRPTLA